MSEEFTPFMPPIGVTVQWFAQAQKNEPPQAAIVIGFSNQRTIELMVLPRRGVARTKIAVPHVDDPQLKRIDAAHRITHGGWDYIPGCAYDPRLALNRAPTAVGEVCDEPQRQTEKAGPFVDGKIPPLHDLSAAKRGPGRPRKNQPVTS